MSARKFFAAIAAAIVLAVFGFVGMTSALAAPSAKKPAPVACAGETFALWEGSVSRKGVSTARSVQATVLLDVTANQLVVSANEGFDALWIAVKGGDSFPLSSNDTAPNPWKGGKALDILVCGTPVETNPADPATWTLSHYCTRIDLAIHPGDEGIIVDAFIEDEQLGQGASINETFPAGDNGLTAILDGIVPGDHITGYVRINGVQEVTLDYVVNADTCKPYAG